VFDSVCGNAVRSPAEQYNLWHVCASYSRTFLIAIVLGMLRNTMVCLQKIVTSN